MVACECAGGHAGYEIAPFIPSMESLLSGALSWVQPAWNLRGGLNTVRHHDMHHRFPTRHFSLYFTHWDRWCGTEHADYGTAVRFLIVHFAPANQPAIIAAHRPACEFLGVDASTQALCSFFIIF